MSAVPNTGVHRLKSKGHDHSDPLPQAGLLTQGTARSVLSAGTLSPGREDLHEGLFLGEKAGSIITLLRCFEIQ